jgi:hypothetical protein
MTQKPVHFSRRKLGQSVLGVVLSGGLSMLPWVDARAAEKAPAKSSGNDSGFLGVNQVTSNVMQNFRSVGVLQIELGVVVPKVSLQAKVLATTPVLRAAWRSTTQEFANRFMLPGRVPDAEALGQRLQAATDAVLGAGVARLVLLSVMLRQ